jgi:hypothetical protein
MLRLVDRVTDGRVVRQVSCPVRESLGRSLVESLENLLPMSNHRVAKLVRPSQVLTAIKRGDRTFPGLIKTDCIGCHYNLLQYVL